MYRYSPPFDDPDVVAVARARNILSPTESFSEAIDRVASALARSEARVTGAYDDRFFCALVDAIGEGRMMPSSQLFSAAGRDGGVAACTVLRSGNGDDSTRIESFIAQATVASRAGMGTGIDLSRVLDPVGALGAINTAMRRVHAELQEARRRPPALMVTCSADHARILEFINAKSDVDFFEFVANISVKINNESEWAMLRGAIAEGARRNGEPGVIFQDVADADNPTPEFELLSTAPCAEAIMAENERCVFVSVNMAAHVRDGRFDTAAFVATTMLAVRAADAAVEMAADGAAPIVTERRRVGVGICGFHSALITMGLPYSRAQRFASEVAETLVYTAHHASMELARTRGPFPAWETSRWRDRDWLQRKGSRRVRAVDEGAWDRLHTAILRFGVRHATVVAFPPTGVVAEILGVSKSYEPHFTLVGRSRATSTRPISVVPEVEAVIDRIAGPGAVQDVMKSENLHQLPGAPEEHLLACARQLSADVHMAVHAAFTGIADEAGSKTVNMPRGATVDEVAAVLDQARSLGLKGVTVFRDGCLDECGSPQAAIGERAA